MRPMPKFGLILEESIDYSLILGYFCQNLDYNLINIMLIQFSAKNYLSFKDEQDLEPDHGKRRRIS